MSKFYKLALTFALSLVLMMALACGVSAREEACDHPKGTYETVRTEYYYEGCIQYAKDVKKYTCDYCHESWEEYGDPYINNTYHNYVDDHYCDGYFWYWRTWCPACGDTTSYESGTGCGCGNH